MLLAADEIARSLVGTWDLLQRRRYGLGRFDKTTPGALRSFATLLLAAPAFVTALAAARASAGLLHPGVSLFADERIVAAMAGLFAIGWLAPLAVAAGFTWRFAPLSRLPGAIVVSNWTSLLASLFLAVPAGLFALGLATDALAIFYGAAAMVLICHLRWFSARLMLGVTGWVAAAATATDLAAQALLAGLLLG
jgi:hypothetical protein